MGELRKMTVEEEEEGVKSGSKYQGRISFSFSPQREEGEGEKIYFVSPLFPSKRPQKIPPRHGSQQQDPSRWRRFYLEPHRS